MRSGDGDSGKNDLRLDCEAIGEVVQALCQLPTLTEVTNVAAEQTRRALGTSRVAIWVYETRTDVLELMATSGVDPRSVAELQTVPLAAPALAAVVARTGQPVEIPDILTAGDELVLTKEHAARDGLRCFYAQPLLSQGQLVGVMTVATPEPRPVSAGERRFLQVLRDLTAVAVQNVQRLQRVEEARARVHRREQALATIAEALVADLGLQRVLDTLVEQSIRVLGVDDVAVWLADPDMRTLTLCTAHGFQPDFYEIKRHLNYDSPFLAARAARSEQMQVIEDVFAPEVSPGARQFYRREGLASLLAIPLCARNHVVGVVGYGTRTIHRFSSHEREFLSIVADLFAVAIENARLYDEVEQALRLREEFMATAAHELRTPVTVIKGRIQLLLRQETLNLAIQQTLDSVLRHVDRISHLTDDLLAVVRVRPGVVTLQRSRFDLAALTHDVAQQVARTSEEHAFQIETTEPLRVDADQFLIGEVVNRLLENALRYSPDNGPIIVTARRRDNEAVVEVHNQGAGLPPERQTHVFEPFYEIIPPGEKGYTGIVSLGLYLAKQIIETHGGQIWLASLPSQGSTFAFSLPLAQT